MPPLTQAQKTTIKSTIPILRLHLPEITTLFYRNLLSSNPSLHNYFNRLDQTTGSQPRALATAVLAYATHIEDPSVLGPVIERIARKHVSLTVLPEHYPLVGEYLVGAFAQVLGPLGYMNEEVKEAWIAAYGLLAEVFVGREGELYDEEQVGGGGKEGGGGKGVGVGWERGGWKVLRIVRKEKEAEGIVSFYLEDVVDVGGGSDKKKLPLPEFRPGQYISVRVPVEGGGEEEGEDDEWKGRYMQPRQYSLSDRPGTGWYRITVKREDGGRKTKKTGKEGEVSTTTTTTTAKGVVSNILHERYQVGDVLEVTHPNGDFYLIDEEVKGDSYDDDDDDDNNSNHNGVVAKSNGTNNNDNTSTSTPHDKTNGTNNHHNKDNPDTTTPLVLISAGIGVTPLISILNSVLASSSSSSSRPTISWIQSSHTPSHRPFSSQVQVLQRHNNSNRSNINVALFSTTVTTTTTTTTTTEQEAEAHHHHHHLFEGQGRMDLDKVRDLLFLSAKPKSKPHYYVCGPKGFMVYVRDYLLRNSSNDKKEDMEGRIHMEIFGVGGLDDYYDDGEEKGEEKEEE